MGSSSPFVFGATRLPAEFDPQRMPMLPSWIGGGLALVFFLLAVVIAALPGSVSALVPVLGGCAAHGALALSLLGLALVGRHRGHGRLADGLAAAVAVLAVMPVLQALFGLYPADGWLRLFLHVRPAVDAPQQWAARMSPFATLALLGAAACVLWLPRLRGGAGVKAWLVLWCALFILGLGGVLGQWMDVPIMTVADGRPVEMALPGALGLLAVVLALFRLAVVSPAVAAYFDRRPDRSVFAVSAVGLLAMLVAGLVLSSGLLARSTLSTQQAMLEETLHSHLLLAEVELDAFADIVDVATQRLEAGAADWFVPASVLSPARTASIGIRIESADEAAARRHEGVLLQRAGREDIVLGARAGWWLESRRVLAGQRQLVVNMPFMPLDRLNGRLAALGRSAGLEVCGRGGEGRLCLPPSLHARQAAAGGQEAQAPSPPMQRAFDGSRGVMQWRDPQRGSVLAAYGGLGGAGVVLGIDRSDLQAGLRGALWGAGLVILLVALVGGGVVHRHVRPLILRLTRTERALNRAQAVAGVGSWYASALTGDIAWTDETYRIFARPLRTTVNHEIFMQCVHPDDRAVVAAAWDRALKGEPYDIVHRILAGGQVRWVHERAELKFDIDGHMTGATGTVEDVTERRLREAELLASRQKLRDLAAYHEQLREEERTHIAREIHDELGQHLTALRMDAALLQMQFGESNAELAAKVNGMKKLIDQTIKVVRGVASMLRPAALDLGLVSAAEWLVGEFRMRTGVECRLELPEREPVLDDARATVIFRILQESLTNIARHAQAKRVEVRIGEEADHVVLDVKDDGVGFDLEAMAERKTFGLLGIRERARMFGGRASITSRPGEGVHLRVEVPVTAAEVVA